MGDVVNFNKARKAKSRAEAKSAAEANRAKFGRTRAEKTRDRVDKARTERLVDGAKIEKQD
jgi:hypothetical protein